MKKKSREKDEVREFWHLRRPGDRDKMKKKSCEKDEVREFWHLRRPGDKGNTKKKSCEKARCASFGTNDAMQSRRMRRK